VGVRALNHGEGVVSAQGFAPLASDQGFAVLLRCFPWRVGRTCIQIGLICIAKSLGMAFTILAFSSLSQLPLKLPILILLRASVPLPPLLWVFHRSPCDGWCLCPHLRVQFLPTPFLSTAGIGYMSELVESRLSSS
jgi:hypothetical protein